VEDLSERGIVLIPDHKGTENFLEAVLKTPEIENSYFIAS